MGADTDALNRPQGSGAAQADGAMPAGPAAVTGPELVPLVEAVQQEAGRQLDINPETVRRVNRQARRVLDLSANLDPHSASKVGPDLDATITHIECRLGSSDDLVVRRFLVGGRSGLRAALLFVDGLVDRATLNRHVLEPLIALSASMKALDVPMPPARLEQLLRESLLSVSEIMTARSLVQVVEQLLAGEAILLIGGLDSAFVIAARGWAQRSVEEPMGESAIRGPRDGFSETLRTNTALVRRRLRDPALRVQSLKVGRRTRTDVAVLYLEGVANDRIVSEVLERIQVLDLGSVLESGYIEQLIEAHHWSPFPQLQVTERPDRVAAALLEGRVGILVDGSPMALVAPATFNTFYQTPEDYYERFMITTLVRLVRLLALATSLTLTALYVALVAFHPQMLPSAFAIALAGARSVVPLPVAADAVLLELTMEVVREASIRLPRPIGPTIGIVGTLVIGEAITRAGIVSPVLVIVVAATTIASFALPSYSAAIAYRILKFPVILGAAVLGLYGVMAVLIVILIHLTSMESFGVPYLAPLAPLRLADLKDTFVRGPLWVMRRRPEFLQPREMERMSTGLPQHQPSRPAVESARQGTGGGAGGGGPAGDAGGTGG